MGQGVAARRGAARGRAAPLLPTRPSNDCAALALTLCQLGCGPGNGAFLTASPMACTPCPPDLACVCRAVDGDFLACGSETSELYVYYKALSKPVAQQAFNALGDESMGGGMEPQVRAARLAAAIACMRFAALT